jgi:hypothetical protein
MLLEYFEKYNRPHAVQSLITAFKGSFTKSFAQKALDSLEKKNKITCKTSGKAKVYYVSQTDLETVSKEKLIEMDGEIQEMRKESKVLDEEVKNLTKEYETLKRELTIDQLNEKIKKQKLEVK